MCGTKPCASKRNKRKHAPPIDFRRRVCYNDSNESIIDGDGEFPSICGTGTEDYFCGAYNFDVEDKYTEFTTPYAGLSKVSKTDTLYRTQPYFNMYRWHITDPIYFKEDLRVTIQALGWRSGKRYMPLQDDISSVAYWYSDTLDDVYPSLPDANGLEII